MDLKREGSLALVQEGDALWENETHHLASTVPFTLCLLGRRFRGRADHRQDPGAAETSEEEVTQGPSNDISRRSDGTDAAAVVLGRQADSSKGVRAVLFRGLELSHDKGDDLHHLQGALVGVRLRAVRPDSNVRACEHRELVLLLDLLRGMGHVGAQCEVEETFTQLGRGY